MRVNNSVNSLQSGPKMAKLPPMLKPMAYALSFHDWEEFFSQNGLSPRSIKFWIQGLYRNQDVWKKHFNADQIKLLSNHFSFELPKRNLRRGI